MKNRFNKGKDPNVYFWRDKLGHEVDCIADWANKLIAVEIKSGKTISQDFFDGLNYLTNISERSADNNFVVYAGDENQQRSSAALVSWKKMEYIFEQY